ncbi:homoserine dehydrogenase [Crassaminicella thermophila]|uniref:Homoserine dehydrogenase n=1 Tax=Crassaminicella thermophila TaxID=2599308 RepID=A0A5C0SEV9_CRATE|nr:homoserine dehydrogenase [Crassaminicella thermophila]QEK11834.1 homoserine dehydrogenase [Crassaminicella thermophila]
MNCIKIGILGLGNVGKGVWNIIEENKNKIDNYLGSNLEIKKILVRDIHKNRGIAIPQEKLTTNPLEIIQDPEIDIIIEVIGGIDTAFEYIKQAFENGKHVVTANKAVIATHGNKLRALAQRYGVELRYEASVGGGIPIINTLTQSLSANKIDELVGIINGTTNYILTQMSDFGMDFDDALKLAQEKGYAEADPTSDIEGEDVAFKLSILIAVAFGIHIEPHEIPREGITKISKKDIEYASQLGYKIKLFATAKKFDNNFEFHVHPTLVPSNHPLASVSNEFNALFIRGNAVGELMLYGKGAGSMPTGSAVMGDILEIGKIIGTNYKSTPLDVVSEKHLNIIGEGISQYYIHTEVIDEPGVLGKIASTFGKYGISLESVVQRGRGNSTVPLVFITHEIERKQLDKALEEIQNNNIINKVASILRVENL